MAPSVLVNGAPAGTISVLDRGFAFGDGIFRTLRVTRGRALNWPHHFRRLAADCALLRLAVPDEALLRAEVAQVAPGEAIVKITLTRGAGRGYRFPADEAPTRVVAAFAPPDHPPALSSDGVRVRRCDLALSEQPRTAGAKTLNRLENVLARNEWSDPAIHEGLLADAAGRLVGGTMSNVFLVIGEAVVTPDLSRCGVVGAQRERVRDLLGASGYACEVRDIAFEELAGAREAFLTNSLIGVWPVARFDARRWQPGPVARHLQSLMERGDAQGR